jgi:hypothetical protein
VHFFDEFDDKQALMLGRAFDQAIKKLQRFGDLDRGQRELIANRLIALVRQGVSSIDALSEAAAEHLRRRR